jgi:hypothetical protein
VHLIRSGLIFRAAWHIAAQGNAENGENGEENGKMVTLYVTSWPVGKWWKMVTLYVTSWPEGIWE